MRSMSIILSSALNKRYILLITAVSICFSQYVVKNCIAEVAGTPEEQIVSLASEQFEYRLDNRADPFVPFITEKAATSNIDMNEIIDVSGPLSGMQLFEPGQLTLVALLKIGNENVAMVEDFTGKGYILTEGAKIGRRGLVKDIGLNAVRIEETAVTRAGKRIISDVVMILKKEGEE